MPSHYGKSNKKKGNLSAKQIADLKEHSGHHTKKHMEVMKREMKKGVAFSVAHEKAMSSVGK